LVAGSNPAGPTTQTPLEGQTSASRRRTEREGGRGRQTRAERNKRAYARSRALVPALVGAGVLLVIAVVVGIVMLVSAAPAPQAAVLSAAATSSDAGSGTLSSGSASGTISGVAIEVPNVVGKSVQVAEALVSAAGLTVQTRVSDVATVGGTADSVVEQSPSAGAQVQAGSVVTLTYRPQLGLAPSGAPFVVVIDAGHQAKPDLGLEPVGPGAKTRKPKVSAGATGSATGAQESVESLAIAVLARDALKAAGVDVVMIRTADDVDISNAERAKIGNRAKADLVVRIHQSASTDGLLQGITTFYPSGNSWVAPIEMASLGAAQFLEDATMQATGATAHPIVGRSDLSGFNYSTVPVVMIECGYLSNRDEDARMATPAYQAKLASGIATGVMAYLRSQ
jgi:N-acetylmuramoyl-L-alanine amidase